MGSLQFELNEIISLEAKALTDVRQNAILIHRTNDIDAAGDEVEVAVRDLIRKKLPVKYYVGHGHIVDKELKYTGQNDLIIADNNGSPVLFTTKNGTEYFPYESIYAFGEIKSTYYSSKKYIQAFINSNRSLYEKLSREEVSPMYITQDFIMKLPLGIPYPDNRPYKNNLFKFMFFVDKGDFKHKDLAEIYEDVDIRFLPNILVIVNQGFVVCCKVFDNSGNISAPEINLFPEYISQENLAKYRWVFFPNSTSDGDGLAFLYFALNDHLRKCTVLKPALMHYFQNIGLVGLEGGEIIE